MKNANKLLATGLAIASIGGATAAEAAASTGGVPAETPASGGVSTTMPSGPTPLEQRLNIERHIESGKPFQANVLEAEGAKAQVYVTDNHTGELMINPIFLEYGGKIINYLSRKEDGGVATMPADRVSISKWIGHHNFPVQDPSNLIREETLRAVPDTSVGVVGFEDGGDKAFGIMP